MRFLTEGREGVGWLSDVSRAGVFVSCADLPNQGAPVALEFEAPGGQRVTLRGQVRWITEGEKQDEERGFGISLREPAREYREFFRWASELLEESSDPL